MSAEQDEEDEKARQALIEQVTSAWRPPAGADGLLRSHPAWHDLDAAGRQEAHAATRQLRALEAALAPDGLSATARAVLEKIRRSPR